LKLTNTQETVALVIAILTAIGMVVGGMAYLDSKHANAGDVSKGFSAVQDTIVELRKDSLRRDRSEKRTEIREIRYRAEDKNRALTPREKGEIDKIKEEIEIVEEKINELKAK